MYEIFADLHVHIGRSENNKPIKITAAKSLNFANIAKECVEKKGIQVVGIIDCASPYVIEDIENFLKNGEAYEVEDGGIIYKDKVCIILGSEIETSEINDEGKTGSAHNLCYFPTLKDIKTFSKDMSKHIKNITLSSQRANIPAYELIDIVEKNNGILVPAHAFTPHKSFYGNCTSSLKRIFKEKYEKIPAVELGLSSDTFLADQISELENKTFLTNSDAHSLPKIAREYNKILVEDISFKEIIKAFRREEGRKIICNYGLDPKLGKYHRTYCEVCNKNILGNAPVMKCDTCESKNITMGVFDRIEVIKDKETTKSPNHRPPYIYQIPLTFIPGLGNKTIDKLLNHFETEMNILHHLSEDDIEAVVGRKIADNIILAREGKMQIQAGRWWRIWKSMRKIEKYKKIRSLGKMIDLKIEIAKKISDTVKIDYKEIEKYIEVPKEKNNGDYAFPCFKLAKELKKAPQIIANEIKEKIIFDSNIIEKIEVVGGYLNFYTNKSIFLKYILEEFDIKKEKYGSSEEGKGKNIVIDYSSPNIAKPFHIGHLKTTVIGGALYNIYKYLGYNVIGVNHLGDYGTQFGKLIEGYKLWGNEYNLNENPIDKLAEIYMRINNLCKEDEKILEKCRENFKLLEQGDEYCIKLWQKFKDLSIEEFQKIYDLLGSKFDSWNGEAFYADKTDEVIDILDKTGKLQESEGARIIDLSDKGIDTPCIICKSNGSTIYATRDLAAIIYRARTYDFDKCIYVTSYEQNLHFKQIFEVAKLMGLDEKYTKGLEHVAYGFVRLPSGKMSTRLGNFVKVEDLLKNTINRAKEIIEQKNPNLENKEEIARKVGIGAVIFNDLSTNRIKDEIFDIETMLNFQGETGPYIQYTYVRTQSVLKQVQKIPNIKEVDISELQENEEIEVIKTISKFGELLNKTVEKNEPSFLARYLVELAQKYSIFYNENKIIVEEEKTRNARLYLTYMVGTVLKIGANLLGIQMPEKM